ncbi:MAG: hypothetical protein WA154_02160 [Moraxellaceae bacterium]
MSCVYIIDTTVFLNLLKVEGRNQDQAQVVSDFQTYSESGADFILPMATIIETGNHIAQNGDGGTRRKTALRFCKAVRQAFSGASPYNKPSVFPDQAEILGWIDSFPEVAGQNKTPQKTNEGMSFGDLSIIKDYEATCRRFAMTEVRIWSLDSDLMQYHHQPSTAQKNRL